MTNIKKTLNIMYFLLVIFLVFIASLVILTSFNLIPDWHLYTVQSGSMEPKLKTGSLVLIKPASEYIIGDVITYKTEAEKDLDNPKNTVTHRVIEKNDSQDPILYTTKGDANNTPDPEPIREELVMGKLALTVPLIGYIVSFAKTQTGLLVLIIVPSTIFVYTELMNIKKEVLNIINKRKVKNEKTA